MEKSTGIPEFLAGTLSLIFFFWLFLPVAYIQQSVNVMVGGNTTPENAPLLLMGALGVLIFGIYGVFGVYFFTRCAEKLYYRFKQRTETKG